MNLTNPTNYSATVPFVDINILANNTLLGHATVKNLYVGPGNNTNIPVTAVWDPSTLGGKKGAAVGREFLSQYISGWNTTLTLQTHNGTIPALPALGHALSKFPATFPTPRLGSSDPPPSDGDGDGRADPHDIQDAALSAGRYLCGGGADLSTEEGLRSAVFRYNHSDAYVDLVLAIGRAYASGAAPVLPAGDVTAPTPTTSAPVPTTTPPSTSSPTTISRLSRRPSGTISSACRGPAGCATRDSRSSTGVMAPEKCRPRGPNSSRCCRPPVGMMSS